MMSKRRLRGESLRVPVRLAIPPKGALARQEHKDECDLNIIVKRAMKGIAPRWLNHNAPQYGDFSKMPSLAEAYDQIAAAEEAFMNLPAQLRRELDNDPRNLEGLTADQVQRYGLGKPVKEDSELAPEPREESEGSRPSEKEPKAPKADKAVKDRGASKQSDQE